MVPLQVGNTGEAGAVVAPTLGDIYVWEAILLEDVCTVCAGVRFHLAGRAVRFDPSYGFEVVYAGYLTGTRVRVWDERVEALRDQPVRKCVSVCITSSVQRQFSYII